MDKPGFKLFTEDANEVKPTLSSGWTPIAIEAKVEEPQLYRAKASRLDSLSSLNKDLKESKTTVKSGWIPIVQKVTDSIKPSFTSKTPPVGIKGLKEVYKEDLSSIKVNSASVYQRLEIPVINITKTDEEIKKELVQSFTAQIKEQDQSSVILDNKVAEPEIDIIEEVLQEIIIEEPVKEDTLISLTSEFITKELKTEDSYQQPTAPPTSQNFKEVARKLKFLEEWIAKISLTGPGGGAGDVITLDHPVKVVSSNYTFTRKDYYVGVNATATVTVTIPDSIAYPGRVIVIKDESGNCSSNPIVVNGTVDNDSGGFILAQDNGGIQMIYREGWRII